MKYVKFFNGMCFTTAKFYINNVLRCKAQVCLGMCCHIMCSSMLTYSITNLLLTLKKKKIIIMVPSFY